MLIRLATPADAPAIASIAESVRFNAATADPSRGFLVFVGTPAEYAARLTGNTTSYVAEHDGQIIAFLLTSFSAADTATHLVPGDVMDRLMGDNALLIDQIGVSPAARGLGAAPALLERALTDIKPSRATAAIMHWPLFNHRSIDFFSRRNNFNCIGEYHEGTGFLWGIYEYTAAQTPADPRYPVGKFLYCGLASEADFATRIDRLAALPSLFRNAVSQLTTDQLDTPPRPGAWTPRQVVHHVADGHQVMIERVRLILTEDRPPVKTFEEDDWAQLIDAHTAPVEESLAILDGIHARLARLLRTLTLADLQREMIHPQQGPVKLDRLLAYLDWHGRHHTAQILTARR